MGLLDVLNGMANGPSGRPDPRDASSGGMSKTTMALLAFLAYKAYRSFTGQQAPADQSGDGRYDRSGRDDGYDRDRRSRYPDEDDGRVPPQAGGGGGLGDILRNILGGGEGRGETVRRGIGNTVDEFERRGQGDIARSWIGRGENRELSHAQLEDSLGEDGIRELMRQTGMDRRELLETLKQHLPRAIDALTPEGRIPSREEAERDWRH